MSQNDGTNSKLTDKSTMNFSEMLMNRILIKGDVPTSYNRSIDKKKSSM